MNNLNVKIGFVSVVLIFFAGCALNPFGCKGWKERFIQNRPWLSEQTIDDIRSNTIRSGMSKEEVEVTWCTDLFLESGARSLKVYKCTALGGTPATVNFVFRNDKLARWFQRPGEYDEHRKELSQYRSASE